MVDGIRFCTARGAAILIVGSLLITVMVATGTLAAEIPPLPQRLLTGVCNISGTEIVVAVGEGGTIERSTDRGQTWQRVTAGTSAFLWGVACSLAGRHLVAVGSDATLLESTDKGATWKLKPLSVVVPRTAKRPVLRSVAISPDGSRLVVVGEQGTIITSKDAGNTWALQRLDPHYRLFSVAFNDTGSTLAALGLNWPDDALPRGPVYLYSSDGGKTWHDADLQGATGPRGYPYRVAPFSRTKEFAMSGSHGTVGESADEGRRWLRVMAIPTERHLNGIVVTPDGRFLVAVGADEIGIRYDRSTFRWQRASMGRHNAELHSVTALSDAKTLVAVGGRPHAVWRSEDAGATWMRLPAPGS